MTAEDKDMAGIRLLFQQCFDQRSEPLKTTVQIGESAAIQSRARMSSVTLSFKDLGPAFGCRQSGGSPRLDMSIRLTTE